MSGKSNGSVTRQVVLTTAVTPDDDTDLPRGETRAVYVGTEGDLAVVYRNGAEDVLPNMAPGMLHQFQVVRIKATGTTATGIRAGY